MLALIWPLVFYITGILYALILITLPFSPTTATVFLFTLIAFWSRLPGVGFPAPFWILYMTDVIDLLAMIVAINLGGIYGGILAVFANIGGRLCGVFTPWGGNISDAIAMFFTCLIIPYVHIMLGGDLFLSMMAFMTIRIAIIVPLDLAGFYPLPLPAYFGEWVVTGSALYFINAFYTKYFGDFFDNLLQGGVAFNWTLFAFATVVVLLALIITHGFAKKVPLSALKLVKKTINQEWAEGREMKRKKDKAKAKKKSRKLDKKRAKPERTEPDTETIEESDGDVDETAIETVEKSCPLCKVDVKGNVKRGFYCPKCNMIYKRGHLEDSITEDESEEGTRTQ